MGSDSDRRQRSTQTDLDMRDKYHIVPSHHVAPHHTTPNQIRSDQIRSDQITRHTVHDAPVLRDIAARVLGLPIVHAALPQVRQTALVDMPSNSGGEEERKGRGKGC